MTKNKSNEQIKLEEIIKNSNISERELWRLIQHCWNIPPTDLQPTFCWKCGKFMGLGNWWAHKYCRECL